MGKRDPGKFEREDRDHYRTWDPAAVRPLLHHLPPRCRFIEPCAGDGALADQLTAAGHRCVAMVDIAPKRGDVQRGDAMRIKWPTRTGFFIMNPPFKSDLMLPMIRHLAPQARTWSLQPADWMHNAEARPFLPWLQRIVSIGRICWFEGTGVKSLDNFAWYLFDGQNPRELIEFYGRRD